MGGRSAKDNFKKRSDDPPRITLKLEEEKVSFVKEADRCKRMVEATIGILRGVLVREPTQDEILGKVDISSGKKRKR